MIKSVTVTNPKNESLVLEMQHPEKTGLYISNIEGLGPPQSTINLVELATIDGGIYTSSRMEARNIVITLGMLWLNTVEDSRLLTYRYFPIKKQIELLIETDHRKAIIYGWVESHEPDIFSDKETTQISIICPDPNFYEAGEADTAFSGIKAMFEFPFSNESLTDNLIEFGEVLLDTRAILTYEGDVDTGVVITIHALNSANDIVLYNVNTHEQMAINTNRIADLTGTGFMAGDDIIISTVRGNRYVQLLRNGVYTNLISAIDKDADWFQLSSGDNLFAFTAAGGEEYLMVTFSYRNAYGGV